MTEQELQKFKDFPDYIRNIKCYEFSDEKEKIASVVDSIVDFLEVTLKDNEKKDRKLKEMSVLIEDMNRIIDTLDPRR